MKTRKTAKIASAHKKFGKRYTPKIDIFFDKEISEIANFVAYVPYSVRRGQVEKTARRVLVVQN
jgi:hypothetical protein